MAKRKADLTIAERRKRIETIAAQITDCACYMINRLTPVDLDTYVRQSVLESVIERLKARV